jgi:hypothetical protein
MTVLNTVEQLRDQFPQYSRTWLLFNINTELQEFAKRTNCILGVTDYDAVDFVETTVNEASVYTKAIPTSIYKILDIDGFKRNEYEIVDSNLRLLTMPAGMETISVTYCMLPATVTNNSDELTIPSEFHQGIVDTLLSRYHAAGKNLQMAGWYLQLAHPYELNAKRYVNERHQISRYSAAAAAAVTTKIAYGQQAILEGVNTITMSTSFANTTYAVSLNYGNIMAAETDPKVRTVNTFTIDSASDNPTFEYLAVGI